MYTYIRIYQPLKPNTNFLIFTPILTFKSINYSTFRCPAPVDILIHLYINMCIHMYIYIYVYIYIYT
jgi:hypothetical protein